MSGAGEIAAALGQGKEQTTKSGWLTLCPVHNDTNKPSLSIKDSTDKNGNPDVTVHCHVGCDWKDIKDNLVERGLIDKWEPDTNSNKKTRRGPVKKTTHRGDRDKTDTKKLSKQDDEPDSFVWKISKKNKKQISTYFASRAIYFSDNFPLPPALLWTQYKDKESGEQVYAVVCAATSPDDKSVKAVQRLFIDTDDHENYKKEGAKMLGDMHGRGVWFFRKERKKELIAGEGVETTLSAMFATSINGVATLSTAGLVNIKIPEETETLYILVDSDKNPKKKKEKGWPGQRAALNLAERFESERDGNVAYLVTPCDSCFSEDPEKMDFNDILQEDHSGESIRARFIEKVRPGDLSWRPPDDSSDRGDGDDGDAEDGFYTKAALAQLHDLNKQYSACLLGGKFRIIKETVDYTTNRKTIDFLEVTSFHNYLANRKVPVNISEDNIKMMPISQVWSSWEKRNTYDNVVFSPSNNIPDNVYNLFRGFPIEPKAGEWGLMKDHMFENLCGGVSEYYDYLMAWMARIIQDPGGNKPGVAVVLKGGKGVGKGIWANAFGKLFGDAFLPIATSKGFTGQFNMHLSKCLFVFLDEAVWGGDKEVEGQLKALITEPTMLFQPKGIDSLAMDNHLNIAMASNNDWVIPASIDERRFFVLLCSDKRQQDSRYFGAIQRQMENGGYEAMMHELLQHDFSNIDLRKAPHTDGLIEQVDETLDDVLSFWRSAIARGFLLSFKDTGAPRRTDFDKYEDQEWPQIVWKYEVYHEFKENFCRGHKTYINETKFWKDSMKIWPGGVVKTSRVRGDDSVRRFNVVLPTRVEMSETFTEHTKIKIDMDHENIGPVEMFNGQF